ncbi:MAG TPA: phosphopentomutase [Candidatus Fimivivens faecavium]|nr:phosphopentomutase [Candidatus Fimivivens faecavium]
MEIKRVFLIVLDSFGVGAMPDAEEFGDHNPNTLASVVKAGATLPNMAQLGLCSIEGAACPAGAKEPKGAYGRMREASRGKDTTTGHWEIAGIISEQPMPTFPDGFPEELLNALAQQTGRKILCNKPYSGTQVILDYGREHLETGALIVYTSADSVLQIAAHEGKVPLEELYRCCETARELCHGKYAVGRVIARPFTGEYPNFTRTTNRHDFSLQPPEKTALDLLSEAGFDTIGVGKIYDIFAGRGVSEKVLTKGNTDGLKKCTELLERDFNGLCFINLVDFDMIYGHRRDAKGYANALIEFDQWLGTALSRLDERDVLMITADHGCDPGAAGTDHTREFTPLLAAGKAVRPGVNLGTRETFADIGATVLRLFGVENKTHGTSFADQMIRLQ